MNGLTKRLLAVTGSTLIAAGLSLGLAGNAFADPDATATAQAAKGTGVRNTSVTITLPFQDKATRVPRYQLKFDNGDIADIYCIDHGTPFGTGETYAEGKWDDAGTGNNTAKQNLPKIKWILLHSTPNVTLADLKALPGFPADHGATDDRLAHLARVATQAAVWHLSDGAKLATTWRATDAQGVTAKEFKAVKFVYDYLTGSANTGAGEEPAPSLKITPATASGVVGGKAGPFEIKAHAPQLTVTAEGGKIVDANGNPVTKFEDGTKFWLTSDKTGEVVVKAKGSAKIPVGRVFLYAGDKGRFQKMILTGETRQEVAAQVKATFTPGLPQTGDNTMTYAASGAGLVAVGAVVFLLARRRRITV